MSSVPTTSAVLVDQPPLARACATWADYVELTKPRIAALVLVAVAVSCYVASWGSPDAWLLVHALVGTALVASSASAVNQWLERDSDRLMRRTASRPLPAGRLGGRQVLAFAAVTLVSGVAYLLWTVPWQAAGWALLTWVLYVAVYTPLKRVSPWNTGIGAIGGALPILIGWSAVDAPLGWRAAALFSVLFFWQFPHFMAIAWLYRHEYDRAGLRMLTVVDPTGWLPGLHAVLASLALLPASFAPALAMRHWGGVLYLCGALALGFGLLVCAGAFCATRSELSARVLLRASLVYLPALFVLMMVSSLFQA